MIYNTSPHLLMDVRSCAMRGLTRHVLGYTSVGDAIKAKAGSAYHAGMAVYLDPDLTLEGPARRQKALDALHAVYDPAWDACPADKLEEGYTPSNLHKLFDRWMEVKPASALPWQSVVSVETAFVSRAWRVEYGNAGPYDITLEAEDPVWVRESDSIDYVRLIVRPDAVVRDSFGKIRYVDTKTTGWRVTDSSWLRALRLSLQTQLYADAVVQKYGDEATLGGWINACEIKKLPGGSAESAPKLKKDGTPAALPKCPLHGRPYKECGPEHMQTVIEECLTDPESVRRAVEEAKRAATTFVKLMRQHKITVEQYGNDALTNGQYPLGGVPVEGITNDKCRFCPTAEWCDAGRVMAALPHTLAYNPWPVEEGKREHTA